MAAIIPQSPYCQQFVPAGCCRPPVRPSLPQLPSDPRHQEIDDTSLSFRRDLNPLRHLPPFREATATTARAGMLRLEHGMSAHRRLPAVVRRIRGRETRADEVRSVATNRLQALLRDVLPIRGREMESRPELRPYKSLERCAVVLHSFASFQQSQAERVFASKIVPLRMPSSTSCSERTTGYTFSSGSWSCAWAASDSSAK